MNSFDEVAAAAAWGGTPIILAVGKDLATLGELAAWLESAVPVFAPRSVEIVNPDDLEEILRGKPGAPTVLIVRNASAGDDESVKQRWTGWNSMREKFLHQVDFGRSGAFVFPITLSRVKDVSAAAPHLMSVAAVLTVDETSPPVRDDPALRDAYLEVLREMEGRYGISSKELVRRVLSRQDIPVPPHDLARWKAAVEALGARDE